MRYIRQNRQRVSIRMKALLVVLLVVTTVQAQNFKLYFANNVGDVTRVSKITQDDSQLKWTQIKDGDASGNKVDVQAVQAMFASKRQKTKADQRLFWSMRDDNLLCFRIDDGKGTSGEYEVSVESSNGKLTRSVSSYFFVNTDNHSDSLLVKVYPKVSTPADTIRFKYFITDWRNDDLLVFKLDSRRQKTGLTYRIEYEQQDMGHTKMSTGRLELRGTSFQSFYQAPDSMVTAVYLVSDGNRLPLDMSRLAWGVNLSSKLNRLWLNDNFTLDKHENRELTIFNMLGSGLFEKFDTLRLKVIGDKGKEGEAHNKRLLEV